MCATDRHDMTLVAFNPNTTDQMMHFIKQKIIKLLWLIVWCLTPFSTVFQLYHGGQCTYPCFSGVLLTITPPNILSKPLAAFQATGCFPTDSGERGMNPAAVTIINPRKEYWPRGDRTSDLLLSSLQC